MKISTIFPSGTIRSIQETDSDTIPAELYAQGYRPHIEDTPPGLTEDEDNNCMVYGSEYTLDEATDTHRPKYFLTFCPMKAEMRIQSHQATLASTDYIITKYAEATITPAPMTDDPQTPDPITALGLDKYDLPAILQERAELREKIRQLRTHLTMAHTTP